MTVSKLINSKWFCWKFSLNDLQFYTHDCEKRKKLIHFQHRVISNIKLNVFVRHDIKTIVMMEKISKRAYKLF